MRRITRTQICKATKRYYEENILDEEDGITISRADIDRMLEDLGEKLEILIKVLEEEEGDLSLRIGNFVLEKKKYKSCKRKNPKNGIVNEVEERDNFLIKYKKTASKK